ncbi:MAG: hypothetical protein WC627_07450 [Legionella sp.]|jgi:hypothetical protein
MAITQIDIQQLLRNTIIQEIRTANFNTLKYYILDNLVQKTHIPAVTHNIIAQLDQICVADETRIRTKLTNEACALQLEADEKEQRTDAVNGDAQQNQQTKRIIQRELTGFRNEARIIREQISTVNDAIKKDESAIDTIKERIWELELQIQMVNNQYNHPMVSSVVVPPVMVVPSTVLHGMGHQTIVHHPIAPHPVFINHRDNYKAFHKYRHFNERYNLYHGFYGRMNAALLLIEREKLQRQLIENKNELNSYERSLTDYNSDLNTLKNTADEIERNERATSSELEKIQQKEDRADARELRARARNVHQHDGTPDLNQLTSSARKMLGARINTELRVLYATHAEHKKLVAASGYDRFRVELAADNLEHLQGNDAPTLRRVEQLANKYVSDVEKNSLLQNILTKSEQKVRTLKTELEELKRQKVNGSNQQAQAASKNVSLGQNNLDLQTESEKATTKAKRTLWAGLAGVVLTGLFIVLLLTLPISAPALFISLAVIAGIFAGGFLAASAYQHYKKSAIESTIAENNKTIDINNTLIKKNENQDGLTANIANKDLEIVQAEAEMSGAKNVLLNHNVQMNRDWDSVQNLQPQAYTPVNERGNQGFFNSTPQTLDDKNIISGVQNDQQPTHI